MRITIVVAMTPEGLIGAGGKLPWHLPQDLKRFATLTTGHAIVMGRKTFDSIGKPLPRRRNYVITRNAQPPAVPGVMWVPSLTAAVAAAQSAGEAELFVVGGSAIYAQALAVAERLDITYIHIFPPPTGDTFFPPWDPAEWTVTHHETYPDREIMIYDRPAQPPGD